MGSSKKPGDTAKETECQGQREERWQVGHLSGCEDGGSKEQEQKVQKGSQSGFRERGSSGHFTEGGPSCSFSSVEFM
jgi:hypothetical protein